MLEMKYFIKLPCCASMPRQYSELSVKSRVGRFGAAFCLATLRRKPVPDNDGWCWMRLIKILFLIKKLLTKYLLLC